jgi:anti-anti-sigma factor
MTYRLASRPTNTALSSPPPLFSATVRDTRNGVRHLVLTGELDLAAKVQLERSVADGPGEAACLVVDMSGLTFLDSTGIHFLVGLTKRAERDGWKLSLVPGPERVQRVLEVAGLGGLPFLEPAAGGGRA